MAIYIVRKKADQQEVFRYEAPSPVAGMIAALGLSATTHEQIEYVPPVVPPPPPESKYGGRRRLTRLEFRRLFTMAEREDLDNYASNAGLTNLQKRKLAVFFKDLEWAQEVNLDDDDLKQGIGALAQWGLITPARAQEILNG